MRHTEQANQDCVTTIHFNAIYEKKNRNIYEHRRNGIYRIKKS